MQFFGKKYYLNNLNNSFYIDDDIESQVQNATNHDEQYNSTFNVFNLIIKIIQ